MADYYPRPIDAANKNVPGLANVTDSDPLLGSSSVPTVPQITTTFQTPNEKPTVMEPFPFKKEFIEPEKLWNNLITSCKAEFKVIQFKSKPWSNIPNKFRWEFLGNPTVILSEKQAYFDYDILVDYFSEEARLTARVNGCDSPLDFYKKNYDQVYQKALELEKEWKDKSFRYFLRDAVYLLTKECTSFKIGVSKLICEFFKATHVLDPSSGWGDRMLGAAAAGVTVYHGVDPNPALTNSYEKIIDFVSSQKPQNTLGPIRQRFNVLTNDFLKTNISPNSYNLVFTSPPFWNWEIYTEAPGQSILGKTTVKEWTQGFLHPYLKKAWEALIPGGYLVLYISDVKTGRYVEDMITYVNSFRGKFLGVIGLVGDPATMSYAYPIWCWQK